MISHALTIVVNELNRHLLEYGPVPTPMVELGNIAEGFRGANGGAGVSREIINISIVNTREEKSLKNVPHVRRDIPTETAFFDNPPVFLNFQVLMVATHAN